MKICREEIFGPVMSVQKFSSLDEVADRANRTRYGLGASIFTKDVGKAHYLSHAIRAGTVWYVRSVKSAWHTKTDVSQQVIVFENSRHFKR